MSCVTACGADLMCYLKTEHLLTLSPFISRGLIITYPTDSMHARTHNTHTKTHIHNKDKHLCGFQHPDMRSQRDADTEGSTRQSLCLDNQ